MKRLLVLILTFVSFTAESQIVPKDTLLNIGDSILVGNCFVNIGNASSVYCICDSLPSYEVYVNHYKDSATIPLLALQQDFRILTPDTSFKMFDGNIALVKLNQTNKSVIYTAVFFNYDYVPQAEILEPGDMIVFSCVRAMKNRKLYTFRTRWYYIR